MRMGFGLFPPVLLVTVFLILIVRIRNARGFTVQTASDTEIPTMSDGGLTMENDETHQQSLMKSSERLHEALQDHMCNIYGSVVVVDWMAAAEVADESGRGLRVAVSPEMTTWKLRGMAYTVDALVMANT